jgi:Zn-dependent peptidase ImmA (M78 family)
MRLPDENYEFIKGEAAHILKTCRIRSIPINGFEIAIKCGILLRPYSALSDRQREAVTRISSDGFFIEDKHGRSIIYYNDAPSFERINMTILHEVGHYILDHGISANGNTDVEEAEAKFFAKYILAPPPLVDRIHPTSARDIMDWFCISWEASVYAFDNYNKWKRRHMYHDVEEYERIILNLFITKTNHIRKRLSAYSKHLIHA